MTTTRPAPTTVVHDRDWHRYQELQAKPSRRRLCSAPEPGGIPAPKPVRELLAAHRVSPMAHYGFRPRLLLTHPGIEWAGAERLDLARLGRGDELLTLGGSTRRMVRLVETLGIIRLSKSQVSVRRRTSTPGA